MKIKKELILMIISFLCLTLMSGCWNYREIDQMIVVGGVAIDKGDNGQYLVTVEAIQAAGGTEAKTFSRQFTMSGSTIFDAVRNMVTITGKKLYWSHTKVVILSKEVAEEGILKFLDWFQRDSETRADINIIVSNQKTAREILIGKHPAQEIKSIELEEMLKNQKPLSKAPVVEIWKVINEIESPGISVILPTVGMKGKEPQMIGTAVFKEDKLLGFLSGIKTQDLLFIRDEIKGGILVVGQDEANLPSRLSLEIFKSKTKIAPVFYGEDITFNINIVATVVIDEISGLESMIDEKYIKTVKTHAEEMLNARIARFIKEIQSQYGVDIFGFGAKIRQEEPQKWKELEPNWETKFKEVDVKVTTKLNIKGSAMMSEPLKMGD